MFKKKYEQKESTYIAPDLATLRHRDHVRPRLFGRWRHHCRASLQRKELHMTGLGKEKVQKEKEEKKGRGGRGESCDAILQRTTSRKGAAIQGQSYCCGKTTITLSYCSMVCAVF